MSSYYTGILKTTRMIFKTHRENLRIQDNAEEYEN